jgi:hypothetical protein
MGEGHGEGHEYAFKKETAPLGIAVISFDFRQAGLSPRHSP